jgi:hypothetical protein
MTSLLVRVAVNCVRGWTWLYTWRMSPAFRETRRAEIESDLWECQSDAAGDAGLGAALDILLPLLIGIPDDLSWRAEHTAVSGTWAASPWGNAWVEPRFSCVRSARLMSTPVGDARS